MEGRRVSCLKGGLRCKCFRLVRLEGEEVVRG